MIVLGVELKASEAIVVQVEVDKPSSESNPRHVPAKPTRIRLEDGDDQQRVREFAGEFARYLLEAGAEVVYIRKRSKKGNYAGGAETFRMEGLIQHSANVPVMLVSPQRIAAAMKKNSFPMPDSLAKYQQGAFACAVVGAANSG